ncbi:MAG: ATP-binding protein [Pseudomonadota bacterium]
MLFDWLKPLAPRSLFGRALLILVLPVIGIQIVVALVFIQRHFEGVTEQMAAAVAREVQFALDALAEAPNRTVALEALEALERPLGLGFALVPGTALEPATDLRFYDVSGHAAVETLQQEIGRPLSLDLVSDPKRVELAVAAGDALLIVTIPRRRMIASNPHFLLVWMGVTSLTLLGIAILFLRNQVRPIRRLAEAAEAFGKGRTASFRPAGAEEVRRAGAAFLSMRARIERQIAQRTEMLMGVSHDLRTPLTRMRLALAMSDAPDDMVGELSRDVTAMERMLAEFLAFGQGDRTEAMGKADPATLATEIAEDARRAGQCVDLVLPAASEAVALRPGAVARALQNLLENAGRHAAQARLTLRQTPRSVEFVVEDDGPGIPAEERETALRPFARLDRARNQNESAGVGLGLAIALDVARGHGGALELGDSPDLGGLRATLRLPS